MSKNIWKIERRERNFTMVDNSILENDKMSFEAKGILIYLLSKPPEWIVRRADLMKKAGRGKVYIKRVIDELTASGHIKVEQTRDDKGKLAVTHYTVFEEPCAGYPCAGYPPAGNPSAGNRPYSKTKDTSKTKESKKETPPNPPKGGVPPKSPASPPASFIGSPSHQRFMRVLRIFKPGSKERQNADRVKKWKRVDKKITEEDINALESFYALPKSEDSDFTWYRKMHVDRLLNQIDAQVEMAHEFLENVAPPPPEYSDFVSKEDNEIMWQIEDDEDHGRPQSHPVPESVIKWRAAKAEHKKQHGGG